MPNTPEPGFLDLFDVRRLALRRNSGLERPVQLGFLLLLLLVGLGTWLNHRHTRLLYDNQHFVAHTREVMSQMRAVLVCLIDAETDLRGYVITSDEAHLDSFTKANATLAADLAELSRLTQDDLGQVAALTVLRARIAKRQEHLDRIVAAGRDGQMPEAARLVRTGEGQRLMDDVRASIDEMEARENRHLDEREAGATASYRTAQATGLSIGAVGAALIVLVYNLVRRYDRLRNVAARQVGEARKRFEVALASIGDAVLVTDPSGRIAYCNAGCESILGIKPPDVGRSLEEMITMISESTGHPIDSVIQRVRNEGGMQRAGADTALRRFDGTTIPVDITAAALRGDNGETQGVVLVVLDVSERRERERELARSSERFRSLVLATSQVVWTTDANGYAREDSPSWRRLTGQTYEQWKGHGGFDALHPDDRKRVLQTWTEAMTEKRPHAAEYRLRMADGSYRWTMARSVPVLDTDGTIREWVGMNYDIQSRKEAEAAQEDMNRRKDEFIALLAHELRNPLAPLRNGIEILNSGSSEDAPRAIEMMDRQVRHMVRLIDDLLDLGRIGQGKLELRLERIDLRTILRQASDGVRASVTAKRQHLSVSLPPVPMWVDGDAVRLTQVVTNLLNNAIKYSGEDASIWLTADREGALHQIRVRDTGQGIPTEMRTRIWDLFLQGGGRAERVEGGLGIGLTLVKRIVELHNGSVDIVSEGVGTGSEFFVRLPIAQSKPLEAVSVGTTVRVPTRALRILVIDDNEDSAESLSMWLRVSGHEVRTAFRGEAGLEEFVRFEPELVLCDIRMPDMSGYEVARRLRAHPDGQKPLLVALTGFGTNSDRESSARAGFDRHLVKPVDPDALAAILRSAAERSPPV